MPLLGLIGYPLSHSFSKDYFTEKFKRLGLRDWSYELFPLSDLKELPSIIEREKDLIGFNVTIPYKTAIIDYLDELSPEAEETGAVNTVKIQRGEKIFLKGYNTDISGFEKSLKPLLLPQDLNALILGSGGASKAVQFVLRKLGIEFKIVSRNPEPGEIGYGELLTWSQLPSIIVNTTPLGMKPDIESYPNIPYSLLNNTHLLYDLVYNPEETVFLQKGRERGCRIKNGLEMLHLQADKAWEIWTG
jgi:shikimate dehydrogenase